MSTVISTLATLVSAPATRLHAFAAFPKFAVIINNDNTITFENEAGEWFLRTTTLKSPISCSDGIYTAITRNSTYSWRNVSAPVIDPNTFYKVCFVDYEHWDKRPTWAREARQLSDGSWIVKTYNNSFHSTKEKADERAAYLLNFYDGANCEKYHASEAYLTAASLGCCKLIGIFKVHFDSDFIDAVKSWSKQINSHGEFAFAIRRAERKQMREELAPAWLDKNERRNRLDYMREFA